MLPEENQAQSKPAADLIITNAKIWTVDKSMPSAEALRLAGITAKTPDPSGGVIVRDTQGNPTGALKLPAWTQIWKSLQCVPAQGQ